MEGAAAAVSHRTVEANGISMHVAELGGDDGGDNRPAIVFLHGFPELWYSWRHQMEYLAARGYRCVAPDLRGYGGTAAPPEPSAYTAFHDVVGLLDALGLHKVLVVGHDWGAMIAWYLCLFRPDRVVALVNTSVAFTRHLMIRAGGGDDVKPTDYFRRTFGPAYYICRFQEPGVAEEEFCRANARRLVRRILCGRLGSAEEPTPTTTTTTTAGSSSSSSGAEDCATPLPPWLTEADVDRFATAFEETGFTGGINYYRNMDRNWELAAPWADARVTVPTKFIVGDRDLTYRFPAMHEYLHGAGGFKADVPLLEDVVVVPGAGHFIQQERADEVSEHIYDFVAKFR